LTLNCTIGTYKIKLNGSNGIEMENQQSTN